MPTRQSLASLRWSVRAVGDLSQVPANVRGRAIPAAVPGCIHTDLMDAGLIPDPAVGMNEKEVQWVSWTDWRYEFEFDADPALFLHHEIDLNFECLDTIATIELNGVEIGKAASEFIPWRFGVQGILKPGRNTLAVTFTSPLRYVHEMAAKLGPRPHNGDEQGWAPFNMIRKCASNFGWDWGPRVATCGITSEFYLHGWSVCRIDSVRRTGPRSSLNVSCDLIWSDQTVLDSGAIRFLISDGRDERSSSESLIGRPEVALASFEISRDQWWLPSGLGRPNLHTLTVELVDRPSPANAYSMDKGVVLDRSVVNVGTRYIRTNNYEFNDEFFPLAFLTENSIETPFIKGANWIPEGLWPRDRTPARCRERLRQALDANMNMIRVWGGGRYEPDWFYDLCDEMGIMVWQDFMFACACYPEEEPLRSLIEREARYQVARLSRHPCVVLWCGGNECHWAYESWGFKERLAASDSPKTWGEHYWREMLPNIVAELSPGTPYWPDSPWSGDSSKPPNSADTGDRHTWDAWGDGYRGIVPRFCSEFGQQAPSNWRTLEEAGLLRDHQRRDREGACGAQGTKAIADTPETLPHGRVSAPSVSSLLLPPDLAARQLGPGGNARWYDEPMRESFKEPRDLDEWHAMAQLLQARSLRTAIEWMRANRPRCMGALVWQLNDAWPGLSWSLIDSNGTPKLAYEAVRQAFAPVLLTIQPFEGRLRLCLVCDELGPAHPVARIRRLRLDGTILAEASSVRLIPYVQGAHRDIDIESLVGTPADIHDEFIVADMEGHRAVWFYAPDRLVHHRPPGFDVERYPSIDDATLVKLTAKSVVRDLWIDEGRLPGGMRAELSSPLRTFLPGERTHIRLRVEGDGAGVPPSLDIAAILRSPVLRSASDLHAYPTRE